jgi:hypothetical protein
VAIDNLSCGFVVRVAARQDIDSLKQFSQSAAGWKVDEKRKGATRDITWVDGDSRLRLRWNGRNNAVSVRQTNGKKIGRFPLYESPLIRLDRGGQVRVSGR